MISFAETVLNTKPNKPEENVVPYTYEETVLCIYEYGECYRNLNKELSLFSEAESGDNPGAIRKALDWLKRMIVQFWNWLKRVFGFAGSKEGKLTPENAKSIYEELIKGGNEIPLENMSSNDDFNDTVTIDDSSDMSDVCYKCVTDVTSIISKYISKWDANMKDGNLSSIYPLFVMISKTVHDLYTKVLDSGELTASELEECMNEKAPGENIIVHTTMSGASGINNVLKSLTDIISTISDQEYTNTILIPSIVDHLNIYIPAYGEVSAVNGRLQYGKELIKPTIYQTKTKNITSTFKDILKTGDVTNVNSVRIVENYNLQPLIDVIPSLQDNKDIQFVADVVTFITQAIEQANKDVTAKIYCELISSSRSFIHAVIKKLHVKKTVNNTPDPT